MATARTASFPTNTIVWKTPRRIHHPMAATSSSTNTSAAVSRIEAAFLTLATSAVCHPGASVR